MQVLEQCLMSLLGTCSWLSFNTEGCYSSIIWVGMCCWDLKRRPIFIPNFAEDKTHFISEPQILSKPYWKKNHIISQTAKLSRKILKFWCQNDEIGSIFAPILEKLKNLTNVIPVFELNIENADFETHFSVMSLDRPLY